MFLDHREFDDTEKVRGELLAARGDAAGFLQPPRAPLDDVAPAIKARIEGVPSVSQRRKFG